MKARLVAELEGIGLSDREARVYLAGLELGPATAQALAAKSIVNRPTTYIAVESLVKRGIMTSVTSGKKRYFVSEQPDTIFSMIQRQKRELEDHEARVTRIMSALKEVSSGSGARPAVLLSEGVDGVARLMGSLAEVPGEDVMEFLSFDPESLDHRRGRKVRSVCLPGVASVPSGKESSLERREVSRSDFPFDGNLFVSGDFACLISGNPADLGVEIGNPAMVSALRQVFSLAFRAAGER